MKDSSIKDEARPVSPTGSPTRRGANGKAAKDVANAILSPDATEVDRQLPNTPDADTADPGADIDLDAPQWYLNRELTWLRFNHRVLHEAEDARTPLLERVKFVAIVHSNLDEFFMKRIGGLKQQLGAGVQELSIDGRTPAEQLAACAVDVRSLLDKVNAVSTLLQAELERHDIRIVSYRALDARQREPIFAYYRKEVFPLLTPLAIDPAHPFPFISNLSLNLLVAVRDDSSEPATLVRIKAPVGGDVSRFIRLGNTYSFVALEEVIACHLDLLFPDTKVDSCNAFRVTRNAVVEREEEEADDLLDLIESELRDRKFAAIVRLEVADTMPEAHAGMLAAELGLGGDSDVFRVSSLLGGRDLMELAMLDIPSLRDPPHHPADHLQIRQAPNLFHLIRTRGSIMVHHPYESFTTSVERFLAEASRDTKVLAIKMTLYRTAHQSKIIEHLITAAQNGKHVAVAVELKARFDESANIRWANHLEEAGIHVSYGVVGLKTHSKLIFVIRRDYDGLRRYAHIGTGNYHSGTARIYCDLGMFTCDPLIGEDLTELFNYLTSGQTPERQYHKLLPAPTHLKSSLLQKIEREVSNQQQGLRGFIRFKMNALEDREITRALYRASQAGVEVELNVRDTCRLRPGIAGLSENIKVFSVVGRFLEHARIYYFHNAGAEEYFIGSADSMTRNLESRVEVVTPIEAPELRSQLAEILDVQAQDRRNVWDMLSDGHYEQRTPKDSGEGGCQETLIKRTLSRHTNSSVVGVNPG